jgi:hypothetical protein
LQKCSSRKKPTKSRSSLKIEEKNEQEIVGKMMDGYLQTFRIDEIEILFYQQFASSDTLISCMTLNQQSILTLVY